MTVYPVSVIIIILEMEVFLFCHGGVPFLTKILKCFWRFLRIPISSCYGMLGWIEDCLHRLFEIYCFLSPFLRLKL